MPGVKPADRLIRTLWTMVVCVFSLAFAVGCSSLSGSSKGGGYQQSSASGTSESATIYYDFDDVVVPKELKVRRDATFIYESVGLKAGLMSLKGRVDTTSLIDFFEVNMKKDNWRLVSLIKTPSTLMLFYKESRLCVIEIDEDSFNTYTRVWLAPVTGGAESGILK